MPGNINEWLATIAMGISVLNALWMWISRPARDLSARIDAGEALEEERWEKAVGDLKQHDRRIQRVEDELRHLPNKDDLHKLAEQFARMKTELDHVAKIVTRIDNFLRGDGVR